MIKKIYRLKEREVKKVLLKAKPFFSYGVVLNILENRLPYNRFALVVGGKSVNNNVTRNYFRRRFYDTIANSGLLGIDASTKPKGDKCYDFVFVLKKQTKLDKVDEKSINSFINDINFIIKKVLK